ncbi:trypsin-like peptidase domain-containing protein [Sphaerisporangium sp. NPDC005289]|uniref:trypsin-like peptidase domain-containing protein n=1 Tax=Sphaerisporangium sp. NPDC005289 TaxID=3155247 RepID=UPI0033AEC6F5
MRRWSVRVRAGSGTCGAGVLIDDRHVLTCAHVVNAALGRHAAERSRPADPVELDFPIAAGGARFQAWVSDDGWFPIEDDERGDVAVLELRSTPPDGTAPAELTERAERGTAVRAYGYPPGLDTGVWAVSYEVGDPGGPEWVQLDATRAVGRRIQRGFSGAAVERDDTGQVVGIAVTEDGDDGAKVAWMLPVSALLRRWPRLTASCRPTHSDGPARSEMTPVPPELTGVLRQMCQVSDDLPYPLRGAHGRFPLSEVYVRQSVAAAPEPRRPWEEDGEEFPEEDRRPSAGLAQPFEQVFEQHDHLVIEGAAGLGKTTLGRMLVRHFAKALLDGKIQDGEAPLVPVMLPARVLALHLRSGWPEALRASVTAEYGPSDGEVAASLFTGKVSGRRWLVVVDALDEIPDQDDRERLLTALASRFPGDDGPARFLVTTRPLSPGEIDRLRGPRVGFYELQPFDEEALVQFARNWFDPDDTPAGNAAAEEFLRQVRLAGLEEVLVVPLLATVAAHLHQSRRDRPLPAGRYELYEEYIGRYAQARIDAGASSLATLDEVPGGPRLAAWLYEHRVALMEALATAYTTTETPLMDVARRYLADHAPMPARMPLDWESALAEWLSQTGVLSRSRTRLRFLHQTFAEHLAATARAKALPKEFSAGEPPWEKLVSDLLLGDDAANLVVLHYLHLVGPGAALLDALQNGTLDQRATADGLVEKGAPVSDAQLTAYLTRLENLVGTGSVTDLEEVIALTRHAPVRERLEGLLADASLGPAIRISLIDLLRERSGGVRRDGPALLRSFATAEHEAKIRCDAATVLSRFGGDHRDEAARLLVALAEDGDTEITDRFSATESLARLGGRHRAHAADLLHRLATDPAVTVWHRVEMAVELAKCGHEQRSRAAEILRDLAMDHSFPGWERRSAAEKLHKLGGRHVHESVHLLGRLAHDHRRDRFDHALTLAALVKIEPSRRPEAVEALLRAITDLRLSSGVRLTAARELAELGGAHRSTAARVMFDLAVRPDAGSMVGSRYRAAEDLIELGAGFKASGVQAFYAISVDAVQAAHLRMTAVQLAQLDDGHRMPAADLLLRLVAGPALPFGRRLQAASTLANLGTRFLPGILRFVDELFRHPFSSSAERVLAMATQATLRPGDTPLAATLIHRLAMTATASADARSNSAQVLVDLGAAHLDQAADLWRRLASDHAAPLRSRRNAVERLLDLGARYREGAGASLQRFTDDPSINASEKTLLLLESHHLASSLGADVYDRIASDVTVDHDERRFAVRQGHAGDTDRHRRAVALLHQLATDPAATTTARLNSVQELASLGPDHRARCLEILGRMAEVSGTHVRHRPAILADLAKLDPSQRDSVAEPLHRHATDPLVAPDSRREAAAELGKLGDEHRERGAEVLTRMSLDVLLDAQVRREAAGSLIKLGEQEENTGVYLLYRLATGTGDAGEREPDDRRLAARDLARLGGERRAQGAEVLRRLAADASADADVRLAAAQDLAGLGGDERDEGAELLYRLVVELADDPDERLRAARELVALGPVAQSRALVLLGELTTDTGADITVRRWAAEFLGGLLSQQALETAVTGLHRLAGDGDVDFWNRLWAIESLAKLGPDARRLAFEAVRAFREEADGPDGDLPRALAVAAMADVSDACHFDAVDLLVRLAEDTSRPGRERLQAATGLLEISDIHAKRGTRLLGLIAEDPAVRAWGRRQAAEALARFGPSCRAQAVDLLDAIAADVSADPWARAEAAMALAELSADKRERAIAHLRRIALGQGASGDQRRHAIDMLLGLGPQARAAGVKALQSMAGDRRAGDDERWEALAVLVEQEEDRDLLARTLHELAGETSADAGVRRAAAEALAMLGDERRREAVEALRNLSADTTVAGAHRALALDALATMTSDASVQEEAGEALAREGADASTPAPLRRLAAEALARRHLVHRGKAAEVLHEIATDDWAEPEERLLAAQALAGTGPGGREAAVRLLKESITNPLASPYERAVMAMALAGLRPSYRRSAGDRARALLDDPGLPADRRLTIAQGLAELGTPYRQAAMAALHDLVVDSSSDSGTRFRAAEVLARVAGAKGRVKGPISPRDAPK